MEPRQSLAERQFVAIAKALRRRCRIFILGEPTTAVEKREIDWFLPMNLHVGETDRGAPKPSACLNTT